MAKKRRTQGEVPVGKISTRPLTADDWPVIEELFGSNGACGGCWCMWPRLPQGGKAWLDAKGAKNRRAFRSLVKADKVYGVLAFAGDEPIGWCCFGPRTDFPRLETIRALKGAAPPGAWAIVCFYIRAAWRRHGAATRLLEAATQVAFARGAAAIEGYPVLPKTGTEPYPAAFAWMGVPELFEGAGYRRRSDRPKAPRPIYRIEKNSRNG